MQQQWSEKGTTSTHRRRKSVVAAGPVVKVNLNSVEAPPVSSGLAASPRAACLLCRLRAAVNRLPAAVPWLLDLAAAP
jgi:hypothetical protein